MADWDHIQSLMRAVAERGDPEWQALLAAIEPELDRMARRQPIGRLRDDEDAPREIVTGVVARLHANGYSALKKMFESDSPPHPRAWLRVVTKRAAIDYMRAQPEFVRGTASSEPRWITLVSLVTGDGIGGPDTLAQKRREVIRFVTEASEQALARFAEIGDGAIGELARDWGVAKTHVRRLVNKGRTLVSLLECALEGLSHVEIAERLSLTRREVQLGIGYIEELLEARRFGARSSSA